MGQLRRIAIMARPLRIEFLRLGYRRRLLLAFSLPFYPPPSSFSRFLVLNLLRLQLLAPLR
jgi:hypothetical protein